MRLRRLPSPAGVPAEVGDLDGELERDFAVVVHARLDRDLDADVLVLERRRRKATEPFRSCTPVME